MKEWSLMAEKVDATDGTGIIKRMQGRWKDTFYLSEDVNRLKTACEGLLEFIRIKYPDDFKEGGQGFTCPHHQAIYEILQEE